MFGCGLKDGIHGLGRRAGHRVHDSRGGPLHCLLKVSLNLRFLTDFHLSGVVKRIELPIQRIVPIGKPPIGGPPTTYADWTSADWELCRSQKMGIVPIPVGIVPILICLDSAGLGGLVNNLFALTTSL